MLKRDLKMRILGLSAVEKLRAKQQSRLTAIKAENANSKLFYLRINGRKRKNFIQSLHTDRGMVTDHKEKEQHIHDHFSKQFGAPVQRQFTLDWEALAIHRHDLSVLEEDFTEDEVHNVVRDIASDKAPGPDGYIGAFFKASWQVKKFDLMAVINYFCSQHDRHFKQLNSAHMILIPKKMDALSLADYRPISLTHSVAKLVSKLLANRLAPYLNQIVSRAQSAFIKKRSIHDNFLYTQNMIRELTRAKIPALFLKLDIAKAFDTVRWDYLLELLSAMGFGARWCSWISILLSTASTSVFLNGSRGKWFKYHTGLRQGDPLSPLLFILAMEPLQLLIQKAVTDGGLQNMNVRNARLRLSLYADDAAMFLKPTREEVTKVQEILAAFGTASGLVVNTAKSAVYPICCGDIDLNEVLE